MTLDLSIPALTVRQPWAWLIANGHKHVENRTWRTSYRGPLLIHAAKGLTDAEWADCVRFVKVVAPEICIPFRPALQRGGIIAKCELYDCVRHHDVRKPEWFGVRKPEWFVGPFGFLLRNAEPVPFYECRGALGIFKVS